MKKTEINHQKKMARLYYQDKIVQLSKDNMSIRDITHYINNSCIARSKFKNITLSKSTIHSIIKRY